MNPKLNLIIRFFDSRRDSIAHLCHIHKSFISCGHYSLLYATNILDQQIAFSSVSFGNCYKSRERACPFGFKLLKSNNKTTVNRQNLHMRVCVACLFKFRAHHLKHIYQIASIIFSLLIPSYFFFLFCFISAGRSNS